jgi:lycopene beta-cyclase
MVKGLDFLQPVFDCFRQENYHFHPESLGNRRIRNYNFGTNGKRILSCSKLFNSIYNKQSENQTKYPVLQQHFIGWFIKMSKLYSIWSKPRLWIFGRTKGNTVYVRVATSKTEALLEYTLFSHQHLKKE